MEKYIYKITNLIDAKVYIGQTNNPQKRWKEHQRLGSMTYINNKNKHSRLYLAMRKYGVENFTFEVIEAIGRDSKKIKKHISKMYEGSLNY